MQRRKRLSDGGKTLFFDAGGVRQIAAADFDDNPADAVKDLSFMQPLSHDVASNEDERERASLFCSSCCSCAFCSSFALSFWRSSISATWQSISLPPSPVSAKAWNNPVPLLEQNA